MKKIAGYSVSVAGLLVFALSYPEVRIPLSITFLDNIGDLYLSLIGVALMVGGIAMLYFSSKRTQSKEIPIYEGHGKHRQIVGLQRVGK